MVPIHTTIVWALAHHCISLGQPKGTSLNLASTRHKGFLLRFFLHEFSKGSQS